MADDVGENCARTPESSSGSNENSSIEGQSGAIVLEATNTLATSIMVHNQGKTREFSSLQSSLIERFINHRFDGGSSHWAFFNAVHDAVTGNKTADTPNNEKLGCYNSSLQVQYTNFSRSINTSSAKLILKLALMTLEPEFLRPFHPETS